jgi:hypothetical protein
MDSIQEGSSSMILPWKHNTIQKKRKKSANTLTLFEQRVIHGIIENLTQKTKVLKTPKLYNDFKYPNHYIMEKINTDTPIWLGDPHIHLHYETLFMKTLLHEIQDLWKNMWNYGYAPWDFELYIQPNKEVMIIDFDKFGKRISHTNSLMMPLQTPLEDFFDHICFPPRFTNNFPHTVMEHFHPSRISYMKLAA